MTRADLSKALHSILLSDDKKSDQSFSHNKLNSNLSLAVEFLKPLQEDIKLLSESLIHIIKNHSGIANGNPETLTVLVTTVLDTCKAYSSSKSEDDFVRLVNTVSNIKTPQDFVECSRALLEILMLSELAEKQHRIRRWRGYARGESEIYFKHTVEDSFKTLLAKGFSPSDIYEGFCRQTVELVLTAHPTQAARRTLLTKYANISNLLELKDRQSLIPSEAFNWKNNIRKEILSAWRSNTVRRLKPTPVDEARGVLSVIEKNIWIAYPYFLKTIDYVLDKYGCKRLPLSTTLFKFDTWCGGDRDGNPFVTAKTTISAIDFNRWRAASLYYEEVDQLLFEISITKSSKEFQNFLEHFSEKYSSINYVNSVHLDFSHGNIPEEEVYRKMLCIMRERLKITMNYLEARIGGESYQTPPFGLIESSRDLLEPLEACYHSLLHCSDEDIANGRLLDLIRRVYSFGVSLVRLDLRQESDKHSDALDKITLYIEMGSYKQWSDETKITFLINELKSKRPLVPLNFISDDENVNEVYDTFRMLSSVPQETLGVYIISMTRSPHDILAVHLLQKCFGSTCIPVVPLFETKSDLENSKSIIKFLLDIEYFRSVLVKNKTIQIMLGYSDSAKDSGRISSVWSLYKAQEELVDVCKNYEVDVLFFHGRGGSVGRGGGPQHLAILSQPPGSVKNGKMRVTIQGEVIDSHFGFIGTACQTLERYTAATLISSMSPPNPPNSEWRNVMEYLNRESCAEFKKRVYQDFLFSKYFAYATPIFELSYLNIGSRPSHRRPGGSPLLDGVKIESLRAIPWVFSWTQNRSHMPVWLGVGFAMQKAIEDGYLDLLQEMYAEWPFFKSTIDLIQMVLAKANSRVTKFYEDTLVQEDNLKVVGEGFLAELNRSISSILMITKQAELLQNDPVVLRNIEVRLPVVEALNCIQANLLKILRDKSWEIRSEEDQLLKDALVITIQGVALGMGNTG